MVLPTSPNEYADLGHPESAQGGASSKTVIVRTLAANTMSGVLKPTFSAPSRTFPKSLLEIFLYTRILESDQLSNEGLPIYTIYGHFSKTSRRKRKLVFATDMGEEIRFTGTIGEFIAYLIKSDQVTPGFISYLMHDFSDIEPHEQFEGTLSYGELRNIYFKIRGINEELDKDTYGGIPYIEQLIKLQAAKEVMEEMKRGDAGSIDGDKIAKLQEFLQADPQINAPLYHTIREEFVGLFCEYVTHMQHSGFLEQLERGGVAEEMHKVRFMLYMGISCIQKVFVGGIQGSDLDQLYGVLDEVKVRYIRMEYASLLNYTTEFLKECKNLGRMDPLDADECASLSFGFQELAWRGWWYDPELDRDNIPPDPETDAILKKAEAWRVVLDNLETSGVIDLHALPETLDLAS